MFHGESKPATGPVTGKNILAVFRYGPRAVSLVWQTSRGLTLVMGALTVIAGILPAVTAYVGKLIVDGVLAAGRGGSSEDLKRVLLLVVLEGLVVVCLAATQKGIAVSTSLLRALLSQKVNVLILEKALTLRLQHFEDSEFYDRLTQARREASSRPLSLVNRTFSLVQNSISLLTYSGLLLQFSAWAVVVLLLAGLPAFIAEARFSGEAFRLFRWRSPETRKRAYLEMVLAREDYTKEVQLFQLGPLLLDRYKNIFHRLFKEDRSLTLRRGFWGFLLGGLSTLAFYAAYGWIVLVTAQGAITLGEMTMYLLVFRQGQAAFSAMLTSIGGMYEDNLYISNLYSFLEEDTGIEAGNETRGPDPGAGIRFEDVWFSYPGADESAIQGVSFQIRPGEKLAFVGQNGSGKTTLIKLLTRLYDPDRGRISLDGLELGRWDLNLLRQRIGVIFQDFVRYQFTVGENLGVGDISAFDDEERWRQASEKGQSRPFIEKLDKGYRTQLGRWFKGGRELSGGQWQKMALSRAFMRTDADILVLDEPTASIDSEAELKLFNHFREVTQNQMAILISHRFSTVRMADRILVLDQGRVIEEGSHGALMELGGTYAHLFSLQAAGYV